MKGYKGMTAYMYCRGMQYEIGKSYHEDNIALCERGLHFCKNLRDVFRFYGLEDGNRFFEVEATGNIYQGGNKCVASDLTIIRELTDIEVNRNYYGNGYGDDDGYGYGNGYGDDDGYGYGYGDGDGYGYGYGDGNGNGYGDGDGYGNGYGDDDGDGNGYGYGIQNVLIFKEV